MAVAYKAFATQTQDRAASERIPVNGGVEITERCNLNCRFCYINRPAGDRQAREREMSTQEICRLLDQAAEGGCLWLQLSGGEPLLRKDFPEIYRHAKSRGFLIRLFTNATLVTDEIADMLAQWRPFSVEVTIYGATQKTYETVTQVKGSYRRFIAGMERLLARGLPLVLKTTLCTLNAHELDQMRAVARSWGLSFRYDPEINPRLDGSKAPLAYRLSPEEIVALDIADRERSLELAPKSVSGYRPEGQAPLFDCLAGESVFHMDAYGKISLCILSRFASYDWRHSQDFSAGWEELGRRRSGVSRAVGAEEPLSYHHCAGWSWMEEGSPDRPVGFAVDMAQRRQSAFVPLNSLSVRRKEVK